MSRLKSRGLGWFWWRSAIRGVAFAIHECARRYTEYHAHARFKIRAAALIGPGAFPIFYIIWTYILPQPYESFILRIVGMLLCLSLLTGSRWPSKLRKYLIPVSYLSFLYCLPFFFTLMLLRNECNAIWQMSTLVALMYVIFLYDLLNAIVVLVVGSIVALIWYTVSSGGSAIPPAYWTTLPILAFALVAFWGLAYGDNLVAREKLDAAASLASQVAHEVRTPLAGIRFETERCLELIQRALNAAPEKNAILGSYDRVRRHLSAANSVIDILLANVAQPDLLSSNLELHPMSQAVMGAVERCHLRPHQQDIVQIDCAEDFFFRGSDLLMAHVLINLFKNALRAIEANGSSTNKLSISLQVGTKENRVIVEDTGTGIAPDLLPYVFIPFVSGQRAGAGTGLGLSFSRMVVESFGGKIACASQIGVGTIFTITLPFVQIA